MLRFGKITEVDPVACYARVTFTDDGIVSAWLQILVRAAIVDKDSYTFEINEQVACLMDENSEEGVILGAVFNDKTKPDGGGSGIFRMKFGDGSFIQYDRTSGKYEINVKGDVTIEAQTASVAADVVEVEAEMVTIDSQTIEIDATSVTITGTVSINGIDFATHTHSGVTTGGGISGPPVP